MPTVSILIPVKNAAPYLHACLQSIVQQDFADWECLLLNDGSEDDSAEIMGQFIAQDKRFSEIPANGNGLIDANRALLAAAAGELCTRMDADDIMPKNRLHNMVKTLMDAAPKTLVTGRVQFFPEENCGVGTQFYEAWLNACCDQNDHWQHIWRECVIPSPCWLMRTAELRQAGCFDNAVYPEDYDMAFRLYSQGFQVVSAPDICHLWRQHPQRYSRNSGHYSAEAFMQLKWNYWKEMFLQTEMPVIILGTLDKGKLLKKMVEADGTAMIWLAHKAHIGGNVIDNKPVVYYRDYAFSEGDVVISTLSSIDDHAEVYNHLATAGVRVFCFC